MNFDDTARFFGPSNKLWPELFAPQSKRATIVCRNCRKVEVSGIKRYCGKCVVERQRKSHRDAMRRKRGLGVTKTRNSPIGAEALTKPEISDRSNDPQKRNWRSFSSTQQGTAPAVSEAPKTRKTKEAAAS